MCGDYCNPVYIRYGRICGRNRKMEVKEFANYCVMRDSDCHDRELWHIAYRGKCRKDLPIYRTQPTSTIQPNVMEALQIIEEFKLRHTNIYPPNTTTRTTKKAG
ncbi:uncharacterized protein LOC135080791 [Ostrinia nubilalis]|uniref:uncharacterized protein LOC135080791 n=1 Tax=Ostrinia nubilalis TaxID=29057 RepID=UPI0030824CA8